MTNELIDMKCVTYNIQYGKGKDGKVDLSRIIDEISGADVIALQEVDRFWPRTGDTDQVQTLQDHFSDYFCVYGPGVDLHIQDPERPKSERRQFGNMVLSRYPIQYSRHHLLPKLGSIDALSIQRSAIETTIIVNNKPLRIYSVHLTHTSPIARFPEVGRLLQIHSDSLHNGHPMGGDLTGMDWESGVTNQTVAEDVIIFGDFNFQPDSEEYEIMAGPVSDYGGRITNPAGFVDAWNQCGHDLDGGTAEDNGKSVRIDYCFVSTPIRNNIISTWVDTKATGSDHFPLWLEIRI